MVIALPVDGQGYKTINNQYMVCALVPQRVRLDAVYEIPKILERVGLYLFLFKETRAEFQIGEALSLWAQGLFQTSIGTLNKNVQ